MTAFARFAQTELCPARDHLTPMADENLQQFAQAHGSRLAAFQRHHVDAENRLQLRVLIKVVEHDLGVFAATQLEDHAHAVLVGLIADLGDAFDPLLLDQLGDLFLQARLVDLIGQFGNHDRLTVALEGLEMSTRTHHNAATSGGIGVA